MTALFSIGIKLALGDTEEVNWHLKDRLFSCVNQLFIICIVKLFTLSCLGCGQWDLQRDLLYDKKTLRERERKGL